MITHENEVWYTKKEFVDKLPKGVVSSTNTVQGMIYRGDIKAVQFGKIWYIPESMIAKIFKPNSYIES